MGFVRLTPASLAGLLAQLASEPGPERQLHVLATNLDSADIFPHTHAVGIIRKTIAGTAAAMTGGASLAVVQFRSDTERGTRETKKLRRDLARQGLGTDIGQDASQLPATMDPQDRTHESTGTRIVDVVPLDAIPGPTDRAPGWKADPTEFGKECFWNGSAWTSMTR